MINTAKQKNVIELLKVYSPDKIIHQGELALIGKQTRLSRERVRQIARMLGYQPARKTTLLKKVKECWYCRTKFVPDTRTQKFCTEECKDKFHFYKYSVLDVCKNCKLGYFNSVSKSKRHKYFCTKTCQGQWLANKYGWGKNNPYHNFRPPIETVAKDFPGGFTVLDFAKKYGYRTTTGGYNAIQNFMLQYPDRLTKEEYKSKNSRNAHFYKIK